MIEARDRPAVRLGPPRRRPVSADRLLFLVTIVLVVLALAGLAGLGAMVGATGIPVDGPMP
jgi:hypothetical protein